MKNKTPHSHIICAASLLSLLVLPLHAQANYTIRNLDNQYDEAITYNIPVAPGKSLKKHHGSFSITVPGKGTVQFTDIGDRKAFGCFAPTWGAMIRYQGQTWGFYYEGDGKLDVTIDYNGELRLKPVNGQVFSSGSCAGERLW